MITITCRCLHNLHLFSILVVRCKVAPCRDTSDSIVTVVDVSICCEVNLPSLSPTMEKGNIQSWVKAEGDELKEGDVLAQIETDKATMDFETPEEGFLAKVIFPAGSKDVPIGAVGRVFALDV